MSRQLIMTAAFLLLFLTDIYCQVSLVPMAAFIDPETKTGSMQIVNPTDAIKEVDISFRFGYPASDSIGNVITRYNDTVLEKKYSLSPYIKVFPQKLVIPPFEKQTIRFFIKDLPESTDGSDQVLWTRIVAGSVSAAPQIDTSYTGGVSVQINYRIEMVGLVAFIKGANNSKLDYKFLTTSSDSIYFNLVLENEKIGVCPYWGSLLTEVYNQSNELVGKSSEYLAIYFSGKQNVKFYKEKFPPGRYKARFTYTNDREEIPEQYRPVFIPKTKEYDFEVK